MDVSIPDDLVAFVEKLVEAGCFASPTEVVRAALMTLETSENFSDLPAGALEAMYPGITEKLREGLEDVEVGRVSDGEEFFKQLEREFTDEMPRDHKTA